MTQDYARSIGDGYPDYVDEELGYTYHAWEVISASESRRHERIRSADEEALQDLAEAMEPLTDLERWAFARRYLDRSNHSAYFAMLKPVVDGKMAHPAVHYPELLADLGRKQAETGDLDSARSTMERIGEIWPQLDEIIPLLRAQLHLYDGRPADAHAEYLETLSDKKNVDLFIEAAQDFKRFDADDCARQWVERARLCAEDTGDKASLVDIELLEASLRSPESSTDEDTPKGDAEVIPDEDRPHRDTDDGNQPSDADDTSPSP